MDARIHLSAMSCVVAILLGVFVGGLATESEPQVVAIPPTKEYFTAAVLEHARKGNWATDTPQEIVGKNLDYYQRATALAKSQGADIIVFPEYGLFPLVSRNKMKAYLETVPDPKDGPWNPCIQRCLFSDRLMLQTLSCMAMENDIVVQANTGDIEVCDPEESPNCPEDRTFHYNANTVFDRSGAIISRYRKEHLFFESGMDLPQEPQDPFFTTDFGRFASFVCFDSVFKHIVLAAQEVDGVFLSTMWVDMMPFYNSIQYFQGWAIGNNVTFVVSGLQSPLNSAVGSAVFAGGEGVVAYTFNPDGLTKLLVSKAPKSKHAEPVRNPESTMTIITDNGTEPYDEDDIDFENYLPEYCAKRPSEFGTQAAEDFKCLFENTSNYTFVKLVDQEGHVEACNNGMCCHLDYSTLGMTQSFYLGVVNSTFNSGNHYFFCEEKCLVVRCEDSEFKTCSVFPTKSSTVFLRLNLRANFTTPYVYPSVTTTGLRPVSLSEWIYDVQGQDGGYQSLLNYANSSPNATMLGAALNGRCYDRDPPYIR